MKIHATICFLLGLFALSTAHTQNTACQYSLELFDSFSDGWDGAVLQLNVNGEITNYTLEDDGIDDQDQTETIDIIFTEGDSLSLTFTSGAFDSEVSYSLYNATGTLLFSDGPDPAEGEVFETVIACPACPPPPTVGFSIDDVRAVRADFSWVPSDPEGVYLFQYGALGFDPDSTGTTVQVFGADYRLEGLEEDTPYDVYLSVICEIGDTSDIIGPFSFRTLFRNDVGIEAITSPITQCGLDATDSVEVIIRNYGGNPQSLFPFKYSVNGNVASIPELIDGYYTGVLGKDSTYMVYFETITDLSEPGVYEIAAWTELENDGDMRNDTTFIKIVNIPIVNEYPYFTNFEDWFGGWTVPEESINSSWSFGQPDGILLDRAASGINAWTTVSPSDSMALETLDSTYHSNQLSYLLSPCLDFSSLTEDPLLTLSLFFDTESCCDEGWVEVSIDGGDSWSKVGEAGTGINWYNDENNQWWDGDGGFSGWTIASSTLEGTAGEADVRVRFAFSSDFSVNRDGFGLDNIFIAEPLEVDMAGVVVTNTSLEECGEAEDMVTLTFRNLGMQTLTGFDVGYQIDGLPPVFENVGLLSVDPGEEFSYTFTTPFNSLELGNFTLRAWTSIPTDEFILNDTATVRFQNFQTIPFAENFEGGRLPEGWETPNESVPVTDGHNAPSFVLSDNLWSVDEEFTAFTPNIGPVEMGDSLTFDYRYVTFGSLGEGPKELAAGDSLFVAISTDCGGTYERVLTVDSTNHQPSLDLQTVVIYLDDYVGENIKIRFQAVWGEGDYFIDIDNVNIIRCPASLNVQADIQNATNNNTNDGRISLDVGAGLEPFRYRWSNGDSSKTVVNLAAGTYTVTVVDAVGCEEVVDFTVDLASSTEEITSLNVLQLAPNPTTGQAELLLEFDRSETVEVRIFNPVGQLLQQIPARQFRKATLPIDLNNRASGIYFVQIRVGAKIRTEKLMLLRQ